MNRLDRGGSSLGKNVDIVEGDVMMVWFEWVLWKKNKVSTKRAQTPLEPDLLFGQKAVTATNIYFMLSFFFFFKEQETG